MKRTLTDAAGKVIGEIDTNDPTAYNAELESAPSVKSNKEVVANSAAKGDTGSTTKTL